MLSYYYLVFLNSEDHFPKFQQRFVETYPISELLKILELLTKIRDPIRVAHCCFLPPALMRDDLADEFFRARRSPRTRDEEDNHYITFGTIAM